MNATMKTLKTGDTLTYNYYGKTYTSTVKSFRNHSMNGKLFLVYTEQHELAVDWNGYGTTYNGYSTSFVKCEDNETTRAAFAQLKPLFDENSNEWKQMMASVALS